MKQQVCRYIGLVLFTLSLGAQPILIAPQNQNFVGSSLSNLRVLRQAADGVEAILTVDYIYDGIQGPTARLLPVINDKKQTKISTWFGANPVTISKGHGTVSLRVKYFNDDPGVPSELTTDHVRVLMFADSGNGVISQGIFSRTIKWGSPSAAIASVPATEAPRADEARLKAEAEEKDREAAEAQRLSEEKARADAAAARAVAEAKTHEEARLKAEAEEKKRQEAVVKKLAEEKARAEADATAREQARLKAEADEKSRQEAAARKLAEEKAKAEAEAAVREQARLKAEADEKARQEAAAKQLAEEKAKAEAEAKVREEARLKAEADEKARAAEAKRLADEKAKAEAEAKTEAEAKAREEARLKAEAVEKARQEAVAKQLAEEKAKADAEAKTREEARLKAEAEEKARQEAAAKQLADEKAKAEAEAKAREEARLKAEADEKARQAAEAQRLAEEKAKAEADAKVREEARLRAEAEEKARAAAEAKRLSDEKEKAIAEAKAAEDARLKGEADQKLRQEAEAKRLAEEHAKADAEAKSREEESKRLAAQKAVDIPSAPVARASKSPFAISSHVKTKVTNVDVVNRNIDRTEMTIAVEYQYAKDDGATRMGVDLASTGDNGVSDYFSCPETDIGKSSRNFVMFPVKLDLAAAQSVKHPTLPTDKVWVYLADAAGQKNYIFQGTMMLVWHIPGAQSDSSSPAAPGGGGTLEIESFKQNDLFSGYVTVNYNMRASKGRLRLRVFDSANPGTAAWFSSEDVQIKQGPGLELVKIAVPKDAASPDVFNADTIEIQMLDAKGNALTTLRKKEPMSWAKPK